MDVKGLYPNCKKSTTCKMIEEAVRKCNIEFQNLNKWYLVRFVSILCKGKSGRPGLDRYLPTLKHKTTLNSWIRRKSDAQFLNRPEVSESEMSPGDMKTLLGIALAKSVGTVMSNHFFAINGKVYRQ